MRTEAEQEEFESSITSLERIQSFDVETLPRAAELGKSFAFTDVVEPASRLVELFKRLSSKALDDFGASQINQVKTQSDSCYNLFHEILSFDATQTNAHNVQQSLIQKVVAAYQAAFNTLLPLIGYSLHKTADFQRLDSEARAALQGIKDEASSITGDLEQQKKDAESALEAIRTVAAEQGVTQQAIYFKNEADSNDEGSKKWKDETLKYAIILGIYSVLSLFIHKIPWIAPSNPYETVQMAVSKVLIFAVISFMLYLSARNFLSHKHNAVVNKHRQNALMTYKALVEAAGDKQQASEAILIHAAACIYAPQPTGYTGGSADAQGARSVIELLSKPIAESK